MQQHPIIRYRPVKTPDGEGGYTEALGAAYNCFGLIALHENEPWLTVDWYEDVKVEDIVEFAEDGGNAARYRVTRMDAKPGDRFRRFMLSRQERPIAP